MLCAFGMAALLLDGLAGRAQPEPRILAWRAADGLPQSPVIGVSLTPRGGVLTTHGPVLPVALFDGYDITTVSNTVGAASRVYLNRSGQFWSVDPAGLLEQTGQGWTLHSVVEIRSEYQANPILRAVRPVPLLPLDRNRVLILLADRLLEYDAGPNRTRLIQAASDTGLGTFNDMAGGRDDGAWISGARGLIHIPGPIRQIRPETPLEVHPIPISISAMDLQRPFEDRTGAVVAAADDPLKATKLIVRFANNRWEVWPVEGQNVRQAWSGPDGDLWAHTAATVLRLDGEGGEMRPKTLLQVGRIADLAVEPGGVAWLATSDGLFRIAARPWRTARNFPMDTGPVSAVTSDRRGQVIALTAQGIHRLDGNHWRTTPLPVDAHDEVPHRGQPLFALAGDRLFIRTIQGDLFLGPDDRALPLPQELRHANPLGSLSDGRILLQSGDHDPAIVAFDGSTVSPFAVVPESARGIGRPAFALQTRTGELWVGSERGLVVRRGEEWTPMNDPETGAADGALAAIELPDARLLVGGLDAVREFDGRHWRVLRHGFDRVHTFQLSRDGVLWIASGSGLHRMMDNSWFTLGEEEGLPSTAVFSVFEDGLGRLWAATGRGLLLFDPSADMDPPRAEITGADLPVSAGDNRALFTVGGEDRWRFTPAGRLMFSWKLDNNPYSIWRPAGSVQFTNLAAGTHRYWVRGLDSSGNVQVKPASLEFSVSLPWFKDPRLVWTSAALAGVLIAMGVQALLSYRRLKRSYAEVEHQVAERSAALQKANEELLHSHKMRALGTLAAGVAHDFNNLLSIIKGSTQLLVGQPDDRDRTRQRLQRILKAVDQGAALVRAMLGYSRGAAAPRKQLDASELVQHVLRLLDEPLQGRLRFQPPLTPVPSVVAPPEMLQQIVLNLVQNADEAMDHAGTVSVQVYVTGPPANCLLNPAPASAFVTIEVRDHGTGIAQENLSRVFEPFFTTKGFSSRRGTGLGLSMVYEFAKELGAGIAVESTVGQGSVFRIYLPAIGGGPQGGTEADPPNTIPSQSEKQRSKPV